MTLYRAKSDHFCQAYSLIEVLISMVVVALMLTSLYAGFSSGFAVVKLARENLRATQIMVQKTEAIRILNWRQITTPNSTYVPTSFVDYYNPSGVSNSTYGVMYQGILAVTNQPDGVPADYAKRMRAVTVTLYWTNYLQPSSGVIVRSRQMQTFVARYGMQDYIYR